MSVLLALGLAVLLAGVGGRLRRAMAGEIGNGDVALGLELDLALDLAGGLVLLHLLLLGASLAGIPWSRLAWLLPVSLLLLAWPQRAGATSPRSAGARPGPGDLVAALSLGLFAALAAGHWVTTADFVYHWGFKAKRFAIFDRIDWELLAAPGSWRIHPDYPTLWPELLGATARLLGAFDESILLLWSVVLLAAVLLAARHALDRAGLDRPFAQAVLGALALLLTLFAVGHEMAGAADWLIALAVLLALPALLAPSGATPREDDTRIAVAAALAAGSKIEGVPLAAILVLAHLFGRRERSWRFLDPLRALRVALPSLLVATPWLVQAVRLHLFLPTNAGGFDLSRSGTIWTAVLEVATLRAWFGAPFLLLALPRTRRLTFALLAQLTFYFWVYYTGPVDTRFYVLSSLPRLLLHLVPAALLGIALVIGWWLAERREETAE